MVTWDAPSKQLQRGCRAWQKWKYEILVKPHSDNVVSGRKSEFESVIANITDTSFLFSMEATRLKDKFERFSFSVRATSSSGTVTLKYFQNFINFKFLFIFYLF